MTPLSIERGVPYQTEAHRALACPTEPDLTRPWLATPCRSILPFVTHRASHLQHRFT